MQGFPCYPPSTPSPSSKKGLRPVPQTPMPSPGQGLNLKVAETVDFQWVLVSRDTR